MTSPSSQPEPRIESSAPPVRRGLFAPAVRRRRRFARMAAAFGSACSVFGAMRQRLGWWSTPLVFLLLLLGLVLILIAFAQPLAPFLYPLF
jgi:hypothetical protein